MSKNILFDFASGLVDYNDFISEYYINQDLQQYLQNMVDHYHDQELLDTTIYETVYDYFNWALKSSYFFAASTIYDFVYELLSKNNDIKRVDKYDEEFAFSLDAIPDYVEGRDSIEFIKNEILTQLPKDLSKTQKIKICKEEIKKHYGINGKNYPRWVQSGEWPIGKTGKPMKFVTQRKDQGKVEYLFEDVISKETKNIIQYL